MARLNQIIAIEKGIKSRSFQELTEAHQALQKPALLAGISRTYRPKDEEGEHCRRSPRGCRSRRTTSSARPPTSLTKLFDATATKDWTNCKAQGRCGGRRADAARRRFPRPTCSSWRSNWSICTPSCEAARAGRLRNLDLRSRPPTALATEPVQTRQDEEDAAQPRQGRGDRAASRAGRGLL